MPGKSISLTLMLDNTRKRTTTPDSSTDGSSVSRKKLTHEDYTFGWVCSLKVKIPAALEMLDEEHEALPQQRADKKWVPPRQHCR